MSLKNNFSNLDSIFKKAREGDDGARKLLKMESGEYSPRLTQLAIVKKDTLKKEALGKEIANTIFEMEAAGRLGLTNMHMMYRDRQAYLSEIYQLLYNERPTVGNRLKNTHLVQFMESVVQENLEDVIELSAIEVDAHDVSEEEEEEKGEEEEKEEEEKEEKEGEQGVEKEKRRGRKEAKEQKSKRAKERRKAQK